MANPNWPSFPGLANQTQDGDGRPQVLDLIPGKQRGTPLNSLLFNPLIRSVCDLHDVVQGIGDFATLAQLQNYLSLGGGTLTGDLIISGQSVFAQTVFGGKCVSVVSGYTANSYLQTQIVSGKPVAIIGLQDNSGGWHNWVFDAASGSITRPDGKQFAVIDDVSAERSRAQAAESGLQPRGDYATKNAVDSAVSGEEQRARAAEAGLLPLTGGTLTGDLNIVGSSSYEETVFGGKCVSVVSGYTANSYLQTQIVSGKPVAIVGVQDNSGGWHNWVFDPAAGRITTPNWTPVPEVLGFGNQRVVEQAFIVTGQSAVGNGESWVSFPTPFAAGQTPILSVTINREPGTSVSRSVALGNQGSQNQPNVTNTGFSFQAWYANGDDIHTSGQPWTLHVRAVGIM